MIQPMTQPMIQPIIQPITQPLIPSFPSNEAAAQRPQLFSVRTRLFARASLVAMLLAAGQATAANDASPDELPRRASLGVGAPTGDAGIYITSVRGGSSAERMGIVLGDRLLSLNGKALASTAELIDALRTTPGGSEATVVVQRGDQQVTLKGPVDATQTEVVPGSETEYRAVRVQPDAGEPYLLRSIISVPKGHEPGTKLPVFVFLQGITCSSIDRPGMPSAPDTRLVHAMAKAGFITLRVDKAGLGDSHGPACDALNFRDELAGYVEAVRAIKQRDDVDPQRVYVFGHSMGGVMAPLIAKQTPLRGAIVYGTLGKTWLEYTLENTRRQLRVFGQSESDVTESVLMTSMFMGPLLIDKLTPEQVWQRNTTLRAALGDTEAMGITSRTISGRDATFYHQLQDINVAKAWGEAKTNLLALHGEFDWVSSAEDHQTIADIVARSGNFAGEMREVAFADHGLTSHLTLESSVQQMGQGEQLLDLPQTLLEWIAQVEGEPRPTPPVRDGSEPEPTDTEAATGTSQSAGTPMLPLPTTTKAEAGAPDAVLPGDVWAAFATGSWEGEVTTTAQGSDAAQTFIMRLDIERTENTGTYDWRITYDGTAGKQVREYTLRVSPDGLAIDENNGVVLPASLIGNTLYSTFAIGGAHIAASYELVGPGTGYTRIAFSLVASTPLDATPSKPEHGVQGWMPASQQRGDLLPVSR